MAVSQGPTFKEVYRVDLVSPTGEKYELNSLDALSCDEGKQGEGGLTAAFGLFSNDIDVRELIGADGYGWAISVSNNWLDRVPGSKMMPLWYGPVIRCRTFYDAYPSIELECESFVHHLARRRLSASPLNTVTDFISTSAGAMISSIGGHSLASSVSMTPPYPYPGRDDFGPWSVSMGAVAAGDTISWQEQSGGNLWDVWYDAMERGDMAVVLTRSQLTSFVYSFEAPYVRNDVSDQVVFSVANGTLKSVSRSVDYSALSNVFQSRGSGKEGAQVISWRANPLSVAKYGIFEDGSTIGSNDNPVAVDNEAQLQVATLGDPKVTYDLDVILSDEYSFGHTFGRRDIITFEHPLFGQEHGRGPRGASQAYKTGMPIQGAPISGVVVGWRLSLEANGYPKVGIVVGDVPRNWTNEIVRAIGMAGGRTGGGKLSNRGGW